MPHGIRPRDTGAYVQSPALREQENFAMTAIDTPHVDRNAFTSLLQAAGRRYRNWLARRQVRRLATYETRILTDMGVTRDEILWASRLPLNVNAAWELRHRSRTRRLAEGSIR